MKLARDISMLKKAIKVAEKQTGSIQESIESARFFITGRNFTALIRECRKHGQWEKAMEILEVVRNGDEFFGEGPSFFTFSATISVCSKSGRLDEALQLLREMKNAMVEDPLMKPDAAVYRLIILCSVRLEKFSVAVGLLLEMIQYGLQANKETLLKVLSAMINGRSWLHAAWVLNELHSCDVVLSAQHYNDFIRSAVEVGNIEIATEVFLMMQMVGVDPDPFSCHYMVQAAVISGNPEVGMQLLEDMSENGIPVFKDTYRCLLRGPIEKCDVSSSVNVI